METDEKLGSLEEAMVVLRKKLKTTKKENNGYQRQIEKLKITRKSLNKKNQELEKRLRMIKDENTELQMQNLKLQTKMPQEIQANQEEIM